MPRVSGKRKEYKVKDLKGWVVMQMKLHGMNQADVAKALGLSQPRLSDMLRIAKKGEGRKANPDPFTYGDLLTLCELFEVPGEEKQRLLTM